MIGYLDLHSALSPLEYLPYPRYWQEKYGATSLTLHGMLVIYSIST